MSSKDYLEEDRLTRLYLRFVTEPECLRRRLRASHVVRVTSP